MKINNVKKIEKNLINKIKVLMSEREISNQDIAKQLKVNKSTVSMWLSGNNKMSLEVIIKIANILDVELKELLY